MPLSDLIAAYYMVSLLFQATVVLAAVWPVPRWAGYTVAATAAVWYVSRVAVGVDFEDPTVGHDLTLFHRAGQHNWHGGRPYDPVGFADRAALNPPTSLPLFMGFALLPLPAAKAAWYAANTAGVLGLLLLARRVAAPRLGWSTWAMAVAALFTCKSTVYNNDLGQLSVAVAVALVAAAAARYAGRWGWAGVFLALGTVKFGTLVPFSALFVDRRAWRTLLTAAVTCVALVGIGGRLGRLAADGRELVDRIDDYARPGGVNDIRLDGPLRHAIIGLDHACYWIGVPDPATARVVAAVVLVGLTAAIALTVVRGASPGRSVALAAALGPIFLYHRTYDLVLLAVPLTYALGRHRWAGREWSSVGVVGLCVLAMNTPVRLVQAAERLAYQGGPAGAIAGAAVSPLATWAVLGVIVILLCKQDDLADR